MISYLSGTLAEKQPTRLVLDVSGVGYEVLIPISTFECLPSAGSDVKVLVYDLIPVSYTHLPLPTILLV